MQQLFELVTFAFACHAIIKLLILRFGVDISMQVFSSGFTSPEKKRTGKKSSEKLSKSTHCFACAVQYGTNVAPAAELLVRRAAQEEQIIMEIYMQRRKNRMGGRINANEQRGWEEKGIQRGNVRSGHRVPCACKSNETHHPTNIYIHTYW